MCSYCNHVQRVYCTPTIPQIAYAAGIVIYLFCFQSPCGQSPAARPVCFSPLSSIPSGRLYYIKHMRQSSIVFVSIIGKNSDFFQVWQFAQKSRTVLYKLHKQKISARHRHTSEHIFDNSLSITAYRYSDIDRPIPINHIDTIISIPGYRFGEFEISNLPKSPGLVILRQISFFDSTFIYI